MKASGARDEIWQHSMTMNRMLRFAIVLFGAFALSPPVLAAENWPDSLNHCLAQVRKTI
jgi:hypothetical protein